MLFSFSPIGGIVPRTSAAQVVIRAPGNSNPQFLQEVFTGVVEEEQEPGAFITKVSSTFIFSSLIQILVLIQLNLSRY